MRVPVTTLLAAASKVYAIFTTNMVMVVITISTFARFTAEMDKTLLHSLRREASSSLRVTWVQRLDHTVLRVVALLGTIKKNVIM